ncbi:MAG TPA: hypothetical protein VG142_00175 [Trebonia sp.]|jgi:hypothetical protein|nr:hypothetical protein [Trebonia sp.]
MSKRKKVASIAFTGIAAVTAVGFRAGTALAASGTWKITPNGAYQAENSTSATLIANGTKLTCEPGTATASGALKATGTGTSPTIGSIKTAAFGTTDSPCTLAGLVNFTATLNKPLNIVAKSYNATTGVATGHLAGDISATLTGNACTAKVTGASIPVSFNNGTHLLDINPKSASTLTIRSVTGCEGLIKSGEAAGFHAKYLTSLSDLTITQS